jgi:ubiquinone/menaquinone biosynthesis C-methylase UbiE
LIWFWGGVRRRLQREGRAAEEVSAPAGEETRAVLARTVGLHRDDVVLQIGCGSGDAGAAVAPRCRAWIGCDVPGPQLEQARERLAEVPNAQLVELAGADLTPISTASVDVVYCTALLGRLSEWDRWGYVAEAARVLRPGGRLYVDNLNLCSDAGWAIFREQATLRPSAPRRLSTPDELREYVLRAGFESVAVLREAEWVRAVGRRSRPA